MSSLRRTAPASAASARTLPAVGAALTTTLAIALVASAQASPAPTASTGVAGGFIRPFEYAIPPNMDPSAVVEKPQLVILAQADSGWAFGDLQSSGLPGVLVADVTDGFVHPCPVIDGGGYEDVGDGPGAFLTDMQAVAGLDFEDLSVTRLDGQRAIAAVSTSRSHCGTGDIHLDGLPSFQDYILLAVPSRLIVAEVDGRTILVQAWAASESDLEAWLPIADEFIGSIHFLEPEPAEGATPSPSAVT